MSPNEKSKTEKLTQNQKALCIIATFVVVLLLTAIFWRARLNSTNQPKAAIIDQLGSSLLDPAIRYQNQTFIQTAKKLLYKKFSKVDYYSDNATVDEYKNIASRGYKLIIWRVHSALDLDQKFIAISTSEKNGSKNYETYIKNGHLTLCNISGYIYFGITPKFIRDIIPGRFEDTVIIFMSCNGLKKGYYQTADAFKEKGVKAFIGWDGWVHPRDNDELTILLLNYLIVENKTISEAVDKTPDSISEFGWTKLKFYPTTSEVENYVIPDYRKNNSIDKASYTVISTVRKKMSLA